MPAVLRALLALGLAVGALSAPGPAADVVQPAAKSCKATGPFKEAASRHVKPTQWCSSYLGIKAPTLTRTITSTNKITTTLTVTVGTKTVTAPTTTAPTETDTATITSFADTSTSIITTCTAPFHSSVVKRADDVGPSTATNAPTPNQDVAATQTYPPVPTWLPDWPTWEVATACSCLCTARPKPVQTSTVITVHPTVRKTRTVKSMITSTPTITPTVTETTTQTNTPTVTSEYCPPTVPPTCDNSGLLWAYYTNPWGNNGDNTYSQYDPTYMKTQTPVVNDVAVNAGGFSGDCLGANDSIDVYGYNESCQLFSIMYRGYLYAPQDGLYTFSLTQADDIYLLWLGDKAYSGWTRSGDYGADVDVTWATLNPGPVYHIALSAGEYIPIRFVIAQGYGPYGFAVEITAPDGTVILSSSSSGSVYLQQYPCDPTQGLPYPSWGQEQ